MLFREIIPVKAENKEEAIKPSSVTNIKRPDRQKEKEEREKREKQREQERERDNDNQVKFWNFNFLLFWGEMIELKL